jgi:hypothetical protein
MIPKPIKSFRNVENLASVNANFNNIVNNKTAVANNTSILNNGEQNPVGYDGEIISRNGDNIRYRIFQSGLITTGNETTARSTLRLYPDPANPTSERATNTAEQAKVTENPDGFDQRLIFNINESTKEVSMSYSTKHEYALIDGMMFQGKDERGNKKAVTWKEYDNAEVVKEFYGVPSLMNENSYINLQAAGGKINNKYLVDKEGQKRWYNVSEPVDGNGAGVQSSSTPTVSQIVSWSQQEINKYKFPYKFQDFAYCKYWQKIPNNYLITLRRYPFPTNDAIDNGVDEKLLDDKTKLKPICTMLSWIGESTGNSIASVLGPIETAFRWGEVKADIHEVTTDVTPTSVANPAPNLAKVTNVAATLNSDSAREKQPPNPPIDPYKDGLYANKIIGPVTVIDSVKKRERGMDFKHSLNLVFEYSARSYGGINTKAAALDIISNILLMCSATAPFWGGVNRFMPSAVQGQTDPFLGGEAGRMAWIQGSPEKFFKAVTDQLTKGFSNIANIFSQLGSNPIEGLQKLAKAGASEFMKFGTTKGRAVVQGFRSLLTGEPVGEWHCMIGTPHNPMMMIGNLICTNCKLELGEELGPDDFPTEIKATITLEHGMPRDKAAIESMFNKGRGRIYALPKGYEESFSSYSQSNIDTTSRNKDQGIKLNNTGNRKNAPDDMVLIDAENNQKSDTVSKTPPIGSKKSALYGQGYDASVPVKK